METQAAYKAPEIPSKWDIIPIHSSDRAAFKRCRRYWNWSSPSQHNLVIRADMFGVNTDLWFGTGIHWALEQYYSPGVHHDPVEAWKTWFDIQWRGGVVTAEWLPLVHDPNPQPYQRGLEDTGNNTWKIRGLEDIIPDPNTETFDELFELGIQMMSFYKEYSEANDNFSVLVTEHNFSIPVWDYANDCILQMVDEREDSPNHGRLLEVHARGRTDSIGIYHDTENLFIHDYKTAAKIGEEYFEKLETDEQCTNYLYAIEVEGRYYDLPFKGKPIQEVLYTALRKNYPKPPTILKSGMFSINRTDESTTYAMLTDWIARNIPGVALSEKQKEYLNYLRDVGDEQFIVRRPVRRNRHQIANAGERLYLEALDMLNPDLPIYPNITNDWLCLRCQFRAPCIAKEDGGDWQQMIRDNYSSNKDR